MEPSASRDRAIAMFARYRRLSGLLVLSLAPAMTLGAYWLAGEGAMVLVALFVPLLAVMSGAFRSGPAARDARLAATGDKMSFAEAEDRCSEMLAEARASNLFTAALAIDLGGIDEVAEVYGEHEAEILRAKLLARVRSDLRPHDTAVRIGDRRYLVVLDPTTRLDPARLNDLAGRIRTHLEEPVPGAQRSHYLTPTIGLCAASWLPAEAGGDALLDAALVALTEASGSGESDTKAWTPGMGASRNARRALSADIARALESGQIQPWFQPQICTSTGRISGAEALARWTHPERGVLSPADFLDPLEAGGHLERLGEVVIRASLAALNDWSAQGIDIPQMSVNLTGAELREPTLPDRIAWELDRQDIPGERLCIEVLETAFSEDAGAQVSKNVTRLKRLGCTIDLDDFGTGHASIMALHRLPIDRLKIDRGFIAGIDHNESQRRMVAGILSLAEELGIATLAEGVESQGEHALLAQLGCGHVQGFRIARPMPAHHFAEWVLRYMHDLSQRDLSHRLG